YSAASHARPPLAFPTPCRARLRARAPCTSPHLLLVPHGLGLVRPRTRHPSRIPAGRQLLPARARPRPALLNPQGLGLAHVRPTRVPSRPHPLVRYPRARPRQLRGCCPRSVLPHPSRARLPAHAYRRRPPLAYLLRTMTRHPRSTSWCRVSVYRLGPSTSCAHHGTMRAIRPIAGPRRSLCPPTATDPSHPTQYSHLHAISSHPPFLAFLVFGTPNTTSPQQPPQQQQPRQQAQRQPQQQQQRGRQQARVYAVDQAEAAQQPGTMSGMAVLNNVPVFALFDTGATHTFISRRCLDAIGVHAATAVDPLEVSLASGRKIVTSAKASDLNLSIGGRVLTADAFVLEMRDFDLILGMDWLSFYHADIRCHDREITLYLSGDESITFFGSRNRSLPQV
ncbi:Unknown protein, partial [Striga hermonthica]